MAPRPRRWTSAGLTSAPSARVTADASIAGWTILRRDRGKGDIMALRQTYRLVLTFDCDEVIPRNVVHDVVNYSTAAEAIENGLDGWLSEHGHEDESARVVIFEIDHDVSGSAVPAEDITSHCWPHGIEGCPCDVPSALDDILTATLRDGGGTWSSDLLPIGRWNVWAVGGSLPGQTIPLQEAAAPGPAGIDGAVARLQLDGASYIGTWLDEGTVYIDAIDLIEDTDEAIKVASERGELAIYNLATGQTIRLT